MQGKELIQALRSGRRVYGTAIYSPSPIWPRVVTNLDLDMVFIDTEHTPQDRNMISWMCNAFAALDLAPVVRIPEPDPYLAQMTLDGGAQGIIAPYVETPEQVKALGGAVKFSPLKGQRLRAALDGETELEPELADYLARRNENKALFINIESLPALQNLDAILSSPYVDCVLVGPHDLSCSLGAPGTIRPSRFPGGDSDDHQQIARGGRRHRHPPQLRPSRDRVGESGGQPGHAQLGYLRFQSGADG